MKITKDILRQIIKEEMEEAMGAKPDRDMLFDMADDVGPIIERYTGKTMDKDVIMMGLAKMFGMD